jgi:hypothetical protein
MKTLFAVTALVELGAGLALLAAPSLSSWLLLGRPIENAEGLVIARVLGAALLALGVACVRGTPGLVPALLVYNLVAVIVLAHAGFWFGIGGVALWPAVALHLGLAVGCVMTRRFGKVDRESAS